MFKVLNWNLHSFWLLEIIQVLDSISWVRCASGNVFVMNDDDVFQVLNKVFNVKVPLPRSLEISPAEVREFSFCPFTVVA